MAYIGYLKAVMLLHRDPNKALHLSFHFSLFKSQRGKPWENYTNSHKYLKPALSLHASTHLKALGISFSNLFFH